MDAMWSRLLRLADGRLVKTPAVTALWTAIMLRLVIGRHSMLERGKHSVHHPWQIVHMTSSSKPVVPGKFIDGDCSQFAKPFPASDDTLLVTFTNNLVQCQGASKHGLRILPSGWDMHRCRRLASPSEWRVTCRRPCLATDCFQRISAIEASIAPAVPSKFLSRE